MEDRVLQINKATNFNNTLFKATRKLVKNLPGVLDYFRHPLEAWFPFNCNLISTYIS
jgi:hypothetical protein